MVDSRVRILAGRASRERICRVQVTQLPAPAPAVSSELTKAGLDACLVSMGGVRGPGDCEEMYLQPPEFSLGRLEAASLDPAAGVSGP